MQELGEFADRDVVRGAVAHQSAPPDVGCCAPRGPAFAPWQPLVRPGSAGLHPAEQGIIRRVPTSGSVPPLRHLSPPPAPDLALFQPVPTRLPRVVTTVVVLLVAVVVMAATLVAHRDDARQRLATPVVRAASAPAPALVGDDSIAISTPSGVGLLVVLNHSWTTMSSGSSAYRKLRIEVQLTCTSGEIGYDPYAFQAFDARGQLFDVVDTRAASSLDAGTLSPHERVRGALLFELPRGDVTLLMTDEAAESVTALRILD
ncbi:MAG TPA: hypothetical protein VF635_08895 [Propionibacteriaceae bacterium]